MKIRAETFLPLGNFCLAASAPGTLGASARADRSVRKNAHTAAQSKDAIAHIMDAAPRSAEDVLVEEGGGSEATVVSFDEWPDANVVEETIDDDDSAIESWLARLRPSPSDLAAGAAMIASQELYEHRRMLRYVGERSASRMLGEKVGVPPGRDPSVDAAWLYLADPDRRPEYERRAEQAGRAVPPERRADVMRWIAELVTPRGLRRLRALAQELWVHAGSPCSSATGQPITAANVNWSACWAWCVAPPSPTRFSRTRSDGHDALTLLYANSRPCSGIATSWPSPPARCTSLAVCCSFSSGV